MSEDIKKTYELFYASETGKEIIKDLCNYVALETSPYSTENQYTTAFMCGQQQVVRYLLTMCKRTTASEIIGEELDE